MLVQVSDVVVVVVVDEITKQTNLYLFSLKTGTPQLHGLSVSKYLRQHVGMPWGGNSGMAINRWMMI
jgi:hypothetical protein